MKRESTLQKRSMPVTGVRAIPKAVNAVDGMFGGRGDCETSLRERCPGSIRPRRIVVLTEEMQ